MLIVRFRQTFRERAMEWLVSAGLTGWGLIVIESPGLFARPYFAALAQIWPQWAWGWAAFMIGLMRLAVLFINGAWRRTPMFRQIGCGFGLLVWSCLLFGALSVDYRAPGAATYATLFLMDAVSLSFAAADGRAMRNGRS